MGTRTDEQRSYHNHILNNRFYEEDIMNEELETLVLTGHGSDYDAGYCQGLEDLADKIQTLILDSNNTITVEELFTFIEAEKTFLYEGPTLAEFEDEG